MNHRSLGLAVALALVATRAAAIDLTGRWRLEYSSGTVEFIDVAQSGSAVSAILTPYPGAPVVMSGTFDEVGLRLTLSVSGCAPPSCYGGVSAYVLANGDWFDGVLVLGSPPLPGTSRTLARRCQCVDGNTDAGDGCDADCRIEPCYTCTGMPSMCVPTGDGGVCEDGSPCTSGETCSAGQCGGVGAVSPCIDLAGLFDVHFDSPFGSLDAVHRVEQSGDTVLFRDIANGAAGALGRIDFATGALSLDTPVTAILCVGFDHATGTAAANGASYLLSGVSSVPTPHGCFGNAYTATGVRRTCGDGVLTAPEQCDDGNLVSGDGCDAACAVEACWTCSGDQPSACATTYQPLCARPVHVRKAGLRLSQRTSDARDLLAVRTGPTDGLPPGSLGDPLTSTDYQVCLFDRSLPTTRLLFGARVPAGGACDGAPCWTAVPGGFAYRHRAATPQGISTLRLLADRNGSGQAVVVGRGAGLSATATGLPSLPLPVPLELQVQNAADGAGCFAVDLPAAGVVRNDAASGRFIGRGGP